ncbi:MAG: HIT family protein [Methylobacterium sp.]|nr:HIT family protein [Methylobacterium sp.]
MDCPLCTPEQEHLLWQDSLCRVILVEDADYPGFCRVILNRHVKEMTDLDEIARLRLMEVVFGVEQAVRQVMQPDKINLASLGNVVPHLHWHVIPRFAADRHFPDPIWGTAQRETPPGAPPENLTARLQEALRALL